MYSAGLTCKYRWGYTYCMIKRRDLLKKLERVARDRGEKLEITEGGRHTKIKIGQSQTVVPRHTEIADLLAKKIVKQVEK